MLFKQCSLSTYKDFCKKYNIKIGAPLSKKYKLQKSDFPPDEDLEIDWAIFYDRTQKQYEYRALVEDREQTYSKTITEFLIKELGPGLVVTYWVYAHLLNKMENLESFTEDKIELLKDVLYHLTESTADKVMYLFILENIEQYKKFLASEKLNKRWLQ